LDFAEENLSASEEFDDEPSINFAHGEEEGAEELQSLDVDETSANSEEVIEASAPTVAIGAGVDGIASAHALSAADQEEHTGSLQEIEEHDFDFDELVDDWNDDTKEEEAFPETTEDIVPELEGALVKADETVEVNENFEDDFLDLEDLESETEGATTTEKEALVGGESASPTGKRSWEEHAGDTANNGSDQGKFKLGKLY
jgi:hypothetical protein